MRLECEHQASPGKAAAHGVESRRHFGGVVAVVIDQGERAATRCRDFAKALKPATYAFELRQCLGDGPVGNARLASHGDSRKGILHIVYAREIELHRQRLHLCA